MKFLLLALNSSFTHTNLAVRLLQKYIDRDLEILERTINEKKSDIIKQIIDKEPSHIFWSAYIWNWEYIQAIGDTISKMGLGIVQFVGGPEVSYDPLEHLEENSWIDGIIVGEGEEATKDLVERLQAAQSWQELNGLAYRKEGNPCLNPPAKPPKNLDHLPRLDYKDEDVRNRILYYEAMRGCPYKCAYCLSSLEERVRYRSVEKIKKDLLVLFQTGTGQIKFVDRSFSINKKRALELIEFIKENEPGAINIHLEVNLEDLDQAIIDSLVEARRGLFQIEAGVQTTNQGVLKRIDRKTDMQAIKKAMKSLERSPIHRHLDLIVGLPGEGIESFMDGFDQLYQLRPERIQVGFLKLLRGTSLRKESKSLGIEFEKKPPYTVIKTRDLSAKEILFLQIFEEIIESYCDEGQFKNINAFILETEKRRPSDYFRSLANFYGQDMDAYKIKSLKGRYRLLYDYILTHYGDRAEEAYDYLKMDFYLQEDHFIEKVLPVIDKEMRKSEIMDWLRQLDQKDYQDWGQDIHRVSRMCRGVSFEKLGFQRLLLYKNHKYVKHFDRK